MKIIHCNQLIWSARERANEAPQMKDYMKRIADATYDAIVFKNSYYDDVNGLKLIFKQFVN